jgi:hypothetical protein
LELGFAVYFLVVFGFGGLMLLALAVYFTRELIFRSDGAAWSSRSTRSRVMFLTALGLAVLLVAIPLRMLWLTRVAAVPGLYSSSGVWGRATLNVWPDGTFHETWSFRNEYNGKSEGDGAIQGRWRDSGRDWLTRNITLEPFQGLASYDRGHPPRSSQSNVMAYGGRTVIEVDTGSDITFAK